LVPGATLALYKATLLTRSTDAAIGPGFTAGPAPIVLLVLLVSLAGGSAGLIGGTIALAGGLSDPKRCGVAAAFAAQILGGMALLSFGYIAFV
jgi:hypothetical protein